MFIAALLTIAKTWKQHKCPSTDKRIKKMWYIYTMEYYSAIKKNEIMPFVATWMQLEIIKLNEVNQKEKDKYQDSLAVQWFHCRGTGWIPGCGTKITHAVWQGKKEKDKYHMISLICGI